MKVNTKTEAQTEDTTKTITKRDKNKTEAKQENHKAIERRDKTATKQSQENGNDNGKRKRQS
jgi:hypothetical protein